MAKKAVSTKKKKPLAARKAASSERKKHSSERKPASAKKTPRNVRKAPRNAPRKSPLRANTASGFAGRELLPPAQREDSPVLEHRVDLLPSNFIEDTLEGLNSLMSDFSDIAGNNLTALQRRRKVGAGIRNYGFIEKVADLAQANPQYAQFFRISDLANCIVNFDACREIALLLQSFARLASNTMLVYSDEAFTLALIFYNMVKEMSRRGDPAAMEIFRALQPFFRRPRRASANNPTNKQIDRDIHALMNGTADGKIEVINERPRVSAGKRVLVDDVSRSRAAVKETAQAEIDE